MAVQIKINGVDKSSLIDWASVQKTEILTREPDTLQFMIRNVPSKTYRPALNDDVKMYRDGNLIFGGVVISTDETLDGLLKYFSVVCKDYTEILDGTLVAATYTSQTPKQIIDDLLFNFGSAGITDTNVDSSVTVDTAVFNYIPFSQALTQLANAITGYDWYIDYNKDIHFFKPSANASPFGLDDTSGNFNYGTLEFESDQSQIKNSIVVRGGTVVGTSITNTQTSDGSASRLIYYVGYNLTSLVVQHALAASPTSFSTLTVGKDGVDNPASFDCLYNPNLGLLRFPSAYAVNDVIKTSGIPQYPLLSIVNDTISIGQYGTKQFLIYDKNITTKQQAIDRANAELAQFSQPQYKGKFITFKDGLQNGQYITINCPARSISGSFKIQQILSTLRTPSASTSDFIYEVDFCSAPDPTLIDLLNRLLIADVAGQLSVGANEVPDRIYAANETITIGEALVSSMSHNPQNETITIADVLTNNGFNFGTIFVAGAFTPSSTKRVFVLNGSILG